MRLSRYFLPILRETPKEAEIVSHRLMLRAGMVRQESAGIYAWLPLGLRVLNKVQKIVREEQDRSGAIELLMPTIQSADLWRESGRYEAYGKEMLRIKDRHDREMLFGPTNEEMITEIFRAYVKSYKDLPLNLYHLQWKFRDEVRPRFGTMRSREFLMKDAYSFDLDQAGAVHAYNKMFLAYLRTFDRLGLKSIPMRADTGPIGGDLSHEFIILADTGESQVYCHKDYLEFPVPPADTNFDDVAGVKATVAKWTSLYAATDEMHDEAAYNAIPEASRVSARGIEVGHIFYFGTKYSDPMGAAVQGGHRWPSSAVASRFTAPHNVLTEDDILHLKELPDFDGKLGQRDSELLLSALTVPYLRIPIVVSFFATEDRIHALQSPVLQQLLDSVVFEPGRYLHKGKARAPEFVPSKDETLLNTPYGLLINELARSPTQVMKATTQLLKLALALDTGSYFASQSDIILYVMRFGCRVENFVTFVLNYAAGKFDHLHIRDNEVSADVVEYLTEARREVRQILEGRYQRMLGLWCRECLARAQQLQEESKHEQQREQAAERRAGQDTDLPQQTRTAPQMTRVAPQRSFKKVFNKEKGEAAKDFDALFQIVANLRAHVLLTMRNCYEDQWTGDKLRHAVSIYTFLTARHTWNQNLLSFPEPELFESLQSIRRVILEAAARLKMISINKIMESVVAFVADADQLSIARGWGVFISKSTIGVPDIRQRGRYAVCESSARCALEDAQNPNRLHPRIDESRADTDMGVEINLQLMQLTLKSNHLEALNEPMSSDVDVTSVFGHRSLQVWCLCVVM